MPYSHFVGWVKWKCWSVSISCTIILYAQLPSLLPHLLSSWHRPRLYDDAFRQEEALSSPRCDCCSGHSEGEGGLWVWGRALCLQLRVPRYHGWTTLAPECRAWCLRSACSLQKQPVFFIATSPASPASIKHFLFLNKNKTRFDHSFLGLAKLASICSIWKGGKNIDPRLGKKGKGTRYQVAMWETKPRTTASREALKTKTNGVNRSRDRFEERQEDSD